MSVLPLEQPSTLGPAQKNLAQWNSAKGKPGLTEPSKCCPREGIRWPSKELLTRASMLRGPAAKPPTDVLQLKNF